MLRDEVKLFEELSGESADNVSIERIGSFLDGYHVGKESTVKHAHWILGGAHEFDEGITNIMHCSNCKAYFRYQGRKKNVNYCYRCGAVMDEPMKFKQK